MDDFQNSPMVKQRTMANLSNLIASMDLQMVTQAMTLLESRRVLLQDLNIDIANAAKKEWLEREGERMDEQLRQYDHEKAVERQKWREGL
jgi:hypothetical protein